MDVLQRYVAADAIVLEVEIGGTHRGEWMGIAPTGKTIRVPLCAIFTFTPDDRVKAETVYFDRLMMLSQLGAIALP